MTSWGGSGTHYPTELAAFVSGLSSPAVPLPLRHTVRLARVPKGAQRDEASHDWFTGSAVAVKSRGRSWLLTAAHCIREVDPRQHDLHLVSLQPQWERGSIERRVAIEDRATVFGGVPEVGQATTRGQGPDVAWIPLDNESANWFTNHTYGVFHNLDKEFSAGPGIGQTYVTASLAEDDQFMKQEGLKTVLQRMVPALPADLPEDGREFQWKAENRGGWDYWTMEVDSPRVRKYSVPGASYGSEEILVQRRRYRPREWCGVSGNGLWVCFAGREAEDVEWRLWGIAYWQEPTRDDGRVMLRFHGMQEILKKLAGAATPPSTITGRWPGKPKPA